MKLEKWALAAEFVSSAAIIISLVVLIVEVRGNTAAVQAQTAATFRDSERARRYPLIVNEGRLSEIVLKDGKGERLSDVENFQLLRYYYDVIDSFEWQFREVQAGRLDEDQLNVAVWRAITDRPAANTAFETISDSLDPAFVEFWESYVDD